MSIRLKPGKIDSSSPRLIIILGGGLLEDGQLPDHVIQRLKTAEGLHTGCCKYLCSSIFTLNKPQVVSNGFVLSESREMARYLKKRDPYAQVLMENSSFDTIGSAVFTRVIFDYIINERDVFIVTSDFHFDRVKTIYNRIFRLTPKLNFRSINFVSSISHLFSSERENHEISARNKFIEVSKKWLDLKDAKSWLFDSHENYSKFYSSKSNLLEQKLQEMGY